MVDEDRCPQPAPKPGNGGCARTAAALRESEERFRALVMATSDVVYRMSADWSELRQLEGRGLIGDAETPRDGWMQAYIPAEEQARLTAAIQDAMRGKSTFALEHQVRRADGSLGWVFSRAIPLMDDRGAVYEWLGTAHDITQLRWLEREQRRYRAILETTGEMLLYVDPELRYQWVSPAYAAFHHTTQDALQGRRLQEVEDPRVYALIRPHLEASLAGEPRRYGVRGIGPAGEERWIQAEQRPCIEQGAVVGIVIGLHDLTEVRAAQAALETERASLERQVETRTRELRVQTERLQLAAEAGELGIWEWDQRTGQILWDARLRQVYGLQDEEASPDYATWATWLPAEDLARIEASVERVRRGEEAVFKERFQAHCPDGVERTIATRGRLLADASGAAWTMVGINWDVTEEQQAVLRLQASEVRARALIDASPVPIAIAHEEGAVSYLNAAFTETFGYTRDDIPTWSDWLRLAWPDPVERERVQRICQQGLASIQGEAGERETLEVSIRGKDGRVRAVQMRVTPLAHAEQLSTFYDITALNAALAAAERAARGKADFLAHMSHEIRTPLNAMLGMAQLLEKEPLSATQRHLARRLHAAGRILRALIDDILDFSKLNADQLTLIERPFSPQAVLAQIDSLLGAQARAKGLAFSIDLPGDLPPWLSGDALRLEQILMNLIGNALKFTERGEVRVEVRQAAQDAKAVRLRFVVHDTGIGVDPGRLADLGQPYNQTNGSAGHRFSGTGLGLAISTRLIERLGGTFGVDSALGVGSTFWCELPFARSAAALTPSGDTAHPVRLSGPRLSGPRLSGIKSLVVDDNEMSREVLERALAAEGAHVTGLADGRQALDWLREHAPDVDVVLMDLRMPGIDGVAATRAIRETLGLTSLPIIACSAGVLEEPRQEAEAAGVTDFLAKPVDLEDLIAVALRWCKPAAAPVPAAAPAATLSGAPPRDFPQIPGLDTRRVAELLSNDWALFLKLLPHWTADFDRIGTLTRDDLARGAREDAARRLHSLQGRAAYLGARPLVEAAQALEREILSGSADVSAPLSVVETQLAALQTAVAPFLEASAAPADHAAREILPDPRELEALRMALARSDLAALRLFEALAPALAQRDGKAATAALSELIRSLRFDEALTRLASERIPE